ncbi:MAG: hypothetical protein WC969_09685 [Elusimicrobiota bacterium]|jgi:hypothetical protein
MKTSTLAALLLFAALPLRAAPELSRSDFNRLAANAGLPLFWTGVTTDTAAVRPGDLAPVGSGIGLERWVAEGRFTPAFQEAYAGLVEARRREAVRAELAQGRPVLLSSDFRDASREDRALVERMAAAARLVDELYERQKGSHALRASLPTDPESRALFERAHGPWCEAPETEHDPFCSALPGFPPHRSDAYPSDLSEGPALCTELRARPDAKVLLDPFKVVRRKDGKLVSLPLTAAYGPTMRALAAELRAAARTQGRGEAALSAYLLAAARGFEADDWAGADEAWSRMDGRNSRWYLRVAPDETEFEACQEKAGFHLSFARIDASSLSWRERLLPLRQELEDALAKLVGPPYKARKAGFALPEFIEVVLNAGDSRTALGAILGQSLPNWGTVASEGRRRTVVMTNIGTDADSRRIRREKGAELVDEATLAILSDDREPELLDTILHEASHNLGPDSNARIDGKTPAEVFGGELEAVLEELKAETAALWYADFLRARGLIDERRLREIYTEELLWAFGHVQEGMFTPTGSAKPYAQLAAIQIGSFQEAGALVWSPGADGVSRFRIVYEKMPAAVETLLAKVGRLKAAGNAAEARDLVGRFVTGPDAAKVRMREVRERLARFPKASYLYSVRY